MTQSVTPPPAVPPASSPTPSRVEPASPIVAPTTLEWVALGTFGVVLLTIFFPWVNVYVEFFGEGRSMSAPMALSHVPFFAFLTLIGCGAVIAGTLLKNKSIWLGVARLPAAAIVLLALLIGLVVGIAFPATGGSDELSAATIIGEVTAYPSGLWFLSFLLALGGTAALFILALKGGFAEIRSAIASMKKPATPPAASA